MAQTITFSEYARGTTNPVYTLADGNVVSFNGVITTDGAQPRSPVIAANTSYFGPVFFSFSEPVESVSLDVGYFDNLNSTDVIFYDASGGVIETFSNSALAVLTFTAADDTGIASVGVIDKAFDDAGFSVDTVVVGDIVAQVPLEIAFGSSPGPGETGEFIDAGNWEEGLNILYPQLIGGSDRADVFVATLSTPAVVSIFVEDLASGYKSIIQGQVPSGALTFTVSAPDGSFPDPVNYRVSYLVTPTLDPDQQRINDFIDDTFAQITSLGVSTSEFATTFGELIKSGAFKNADEAALFLKGLGKKLGPIGYALDIFERADEIVEIGRNGGDWRRALAVETTDFVVGTTLTLSAGAGIGAGVSFVGTPLAGVIAGATGGFVTGLVYTFGLSDGVKQYAGEQYDALQEPQLQFAIETALFAATPVDVPFDAAFYLGNYADAAAAVASGAAASAYAHYLAVGAGKGYSPNSTGIVLSPDEIAASLPNGDANAAPSTAVFDQPVGELVGDGISPDEAELLALINDGRTDATELDASRDLFAAANRLAIDIVQNGTVAPIIAQASGAFAGNYVWSNGSPLASGLAISLAGVSVFIYASENATASEALDYFRSEFASLNAIYSLSSTSIGIAEYAGVWVLVIDPALRSGGAPEEEAERSGSIYGRLSSDYLAGGNDGAAIYGLTGDDTLIGGAGDDQVAGGDGNDLLFGGQGVNTLDYSYDGGQGGAGAIIASLAGGFAVDGFGDVDGFEDFQNLFGTDVNTAGYNDIVFGTLGANVLDMRAGGDIVVADDGDDVIFGGLGSDAIYGGAGDDIIVGSDYVSGYNGEIDYLFGDADNDTIYAGLVGTAYIEGGQGSDVIFGGAGTDYVISGAGSDYVFLGGGTDLVILRNDEIGIGDADTYADFTAGQDFVFVSASLAGVTSFGDGNGYSYMSMSIGGGNHFTIFTGISATQLQGQVYFNL